MYIPKYWARASQEKLCCLGWSDQSQADAERLARERLENGLARANVRREGWDYYPNLPVKEEILEDAGAGWIITRNRAGAQVLNTEKVAFVDIDFKPAAISLIKNLARLFGGGTKSDDRPEAAPLAAVAAWAEAHDARFRAYRTARGLRLIRLDRLLDPAADETQRMFEALGTDPQYQRLCKVQKSFRARLTPKPARVGCSASPGSHPRTDPPMQLAFRQWLDGYTRAGQNHAVCEFIAEYGNGRPQSDALAVAALHDARTLQAGGKLA